MLLITAALAEELNVAIALCNRPEKTDCAGVRLVKVVAAAESVCLLKTGVGPERAGSRLERVLAQLHPAEILTVGYAGALDPRLRIGDLIVARDALLLGGGDSSRRALDEIELSGTWTLISNPKLDEAARSAGPATIFGSTLTSPYIIGDPAQKQFLHRKYGAACVDMESGALARVAAAKGIPYGCVRAISDDANDEFLAPVSYDPASGPLGRAVKVAAAGSWIRRYRQWKERAETARGSLRVFLSHYLQSRNC